MSLYGSLYSAISGLSTHGLAMGVIGDNLANMNTIGYKRSRASFQDMMSIPVVSMGTESVVGAGTMLQDIDQVMNQGSFMSTGNGLDLAIQGNGFFVVRDGEAGSTTNMFTRDGQFHVDKNGYLVSMGGMRIQGYLANTTGQIQTQLTDLRFQDTNSPSNPTGRVDLAMNLNADETAIPGGFDLADIENTSHFSTSMTVYDSLGGARNVTVHMTKTGDGQWQWNAVANGEDTASGNDEIQASGTLSFDTEGRLVTQTTTSSSFNFAGAAGAQAITFDFGDDISSGGSGLSGVSQFASAYSVSNQTQDGFPPGDLQTVAIDPDGLIYGTYTNGQRRVVGQVAMADFRGAGLRRLGGNLFQATTASGEALIGTANSGTRGGINSAALEQSNVDMGEEFVNMIVIQRGYQANARTITTSDQMLQEALNIKR